MTSPPIDSPSSTISRRDKWLLGMLFVLAALTYRELLTWNFSLEKQPNYVGWFFDLSHTSPQLHYLLAFGLFYVRRKDITQAFLQGNAAPWSSILFLLPGVCLLLWGHYVSATDIVYLSFILLGFGTARFLSGTRLTRAILFPTLILVLAIPLPAVLINQIVFPFQLWTAQHITWLLNLVDISAWASGDMIYLANHSVRVAESCTALGFMKWLLIFALAYTYLFPASRVHAVLLILSAPIIAYGVNLLRGLSLIFNLGLKVLEIHVAQGVIFFMIGFALLYAMDTALLHLLGNGSPAARDRNSEGRREIDLNRKHRPLLILTLLLSLLFAVSLVLPRWSDPFAGPRTKIVLDDEIGDWQLAHKPPLNRIFLGSIRYSSYLYRVYDREGDLVSLFIAYDDRKDRFQSFLSDKNGYLEEVGLLENQSAIELNLAKKAAVSTLKSIDDVHVLSYHWYEGVDSVRSEILHALLALDHSPWRRTAGALVFRVATPVAPTPQGEKQAKERLHDFLSDLRNQR